MSKGRILVVEDNPLTRKMIRVALRTDGYEVLEAADGASALELMSREKPDLVLQDLMLPDVNGVLLPEKFHSISGRAEVPIIAVSGNLDRMESARQERRGFLEYIPKPVEPSFLLEVLRNHLAENNVQTEQPGKGRRALVVDDKETQRKLLKVILEQLGFQVEAACDGLEALDMARRSPPDAVISDILMPRVDGFHLCQSLREDDRFVRIPIILLSSVYTDAEDRAIAEALGATALLVRSEGSEKLTEAIRKCLAGAPVPKETAAALPPVLDREVERLTELNLFNDRRLSLFASGYGILSNLREILGIGATPQQLLQEVLPRFLDAAGLSRGAAYLLDARGGLTLQCCYGFRGEAREALASPRLSAELLQRTVLSGDPAYLTKGGAEDALLALIDVRSLILMPLMAGAECLGVILIASQVRDLNRDWLSLSGALGSQVGQVLALSREMSKVAAAERRYKTLMDQANDGVLLLAVDGRILEMNPRAEAQFARAATDVVGKSCFDLVCPDDLEHARAEFVRSLRAGAGVTEPIRCLRGDGTVAEFDFSTALVGEENRYIISIARDVTQRRAGERRRAAQYEVARLLSEAETPEDAIGRILKVLGESLGWRAGSFWQVQRDADVLRLSGFWPDQDPRFAGLEAASRQLALAQGEDLPGRIWASGAPEWISDFEKAGAPSRGAQALQAGLRGALGFPVMEQGRILGVIDFFDAAVRDPDPDLLEFLTAIGRSLGQFLGRKSAERERDQARGRLGQLVSASPAVIYSCAPANNFKFGYLSPNVAERLGYTAEEFTRTPDLWINGLHPEDRETALAQIRRMLPAGAVSLEYRFRHKDGTWRWVRDEARVIRDDADAVLEMVGTWTDITGPRETEQRLQSIMDNAPTMIFAKDLKGRYLFVNRQTETLCGLSREAFIGHTAEEIFPSDTSRQMGEQDFDALASGTVLEGEITLSFPSGRKTFSTVKFPLRDAAGRPYAVCGVATDVTERKKIQAELLSSEEMFRQSQKMEAVGRLAGGVAHDFNNLLTVINGYSQALLETLHAQDPMKGDLEEIYKAGQRATSLTRQLLAFSRRQVLLPRVIDLSAVVRDMEKMFRRLIGEDVELRTELDPNLGSVRADPGQIEQVLMNLVVNARDAMPGGGKLLLRTTDTALDEAYASTHPGVKPGPHTLVEVADTGVGMDASVLKHLFEPFFTTKEKGKGTGLGLSTVYGIVKQSGGHIWVYSEVGRGTTFKIFFPQVPGEPQSTAAPAPLAAPRTARETILLVEDEACVRALARTALRKKGYRVIEATDGEEALKVAADTKEPIHLLLTDMIMPRLGGLDLSRRLLELHPQLRVLLMSGYSEQAIEEQGLPHGVRVILEKPFSLEGLFNKVRQVLDAAEEKRDAAG